MPGFFSWISGLFNSTQSVPQAASETRLFNPSSTSQPGNSNDEGDIVGQLEDHLFTWLLDVEPARLRAGTDSGEKELAELERRLQMNEMEELPRKPGSLPMLMRALSNEATERKELTRIILSDPSLTDQLLQVANSPYFRPNEHVIESVDQAVFVLGVDGIRNVIAAAVMRPMMAARNSREALFAQRSWRWGLTCARAAEMIAKIHRDDTSAHFMVGLLPALAYITIRRELGRICRTKGSGNEPEPAILRQALARYQWATCQLLANVWNLPPKYHAWLLSAERPAPRQAHSALTDGLLLGTREVLRHARQRNLSEENLIRIVHLSPEQLGRVRTVLLRMLQEGKSSQVRT
ncbi:histidine kinase [Marinobacter sp. EVN1]|jgi:HD-like signal output (HDOD) protein|uniref:HDOD domain-containing protein n=1 Tax=unclassified Marinobacter TaxID=83889 RepID=UPI0003B87A06|nr:MULTISPECIES: HDOD domain-containing protein [unclassified Marinobacter]ERS85796.1 histidine kinase [Marinobacter sp. EVN1]MAP32154.1 HDOD domain-containing protein [Marinobacter sp.]MCE0758393.1 HDOD domain-containing protein [Marinobacter sp. G11]HCP22208.1 HDOD domain-containing protein [Marinobacter nauticus]